MKHLFFREAKMISEKTDFNASVGFFAVFFLFFLGFSQAFAQVPVSKQTCQDCHGKVTPGIVSDWQESKHSANNVECSVCHGTKHNQADDPDKARIPSPETCAGCHSLQVEQFKKGKHALAWSSMKAIPSAHWQPMSMIEGLKGCGGCHKIGLKTEEDIKELEETAEGFGVASCDACHTRHSFSIDEARQPQACQTCHMGFDHPQWEMYSSSKHGVRYALKQNKVLTENTVAPTCQTCHIKEGSHNNRTAWGFLAVRLPMPEDKDWQADREVILQGLGVLDPEGKPAARFELVKSLDLARLTQEEWQKARDAMLDNCGKCHSAKFAKEQLSKADNIIREADRLMAEAIRIVAGLYKAGTLKKPQNYAYDFPDLLAFHEASSPIEMKLFEMFSDYRMKAFKGGFHMNPDYTFWYGWSKLKASLTEIKSMANDLRKSK
jgi:hypothetical protein